MAVFKNKKHRGRNRITGRKRQKLMSKILRKAREEQEAVQDKISDFNFNN